MKRPGLVPGRFYDQSEKRGMSEYTVKDRVAIVGVGETKYYKRGKAPVSEFRLACEAIIKAADDAGIDVRDIDGISGYANDRNEASNKRQGLSAEERAKLPPLPEVSWTRIIDHIDHMVKLVGATHVGLGSDFDGATMPSGMDDVSMLPKITAALLAKGYSEKDVTGILGGNLLRVMENVERIGREIRAGRVGQ